jgi:hypothetical protein
MKHNKVSLMFLNIHTFLPEELLKKEVFINSSSDIDIVFASDNPLIKKYFTMLEIIYLY